uniref:Collagen IV NC1 domain-containing protein n=1 Tax=Mastacembelus armatus TaxID=205130 RepID=A0A3Q3SQ84_9TELE
MSGTWSLCVFLNISPAGQRGESVDAIIHAVPGHKGEPGESGPLGPQGHPGLYGAPGAPGESGMIFHSQKLLSIVAAGCKGSQGQAGKKGPIGNPGLKGDQGDRGFPGLHGATGARGTVGIKGIRGPPGPCEETRKGGSFLFTKHSQRHLIPECPTGSERVYSGYSLLFINGNNRAHGQDLGTLGSCLPHFSTMPFLFCNTEHTCRYASRNDYSYWLSTDTPLPDGVPFISEQGLKDYISRCTVCEATANVIAIHSQTTFIPDCPSGWDSLWSGYSFVMETGVGAEGSGQPLASPGSCLEHFRKIPFIECHGRGTCNYFIDAYSYWLAALNPYDMFSKPMPQINKDNPASLISHCRVCMKRL